MTGQELLGILIAIVVIWFILKLAKVAIKMIIFFILVMLVGYLAYTMFLVR